MLCTYSSRGEKAVCDMQYRKVEGTHSLLARMHRQIAVWICIGPYFLTSPERKKSYEKREREQEREREREKKSWLSSFRFSSGSSFGPYPVFSQPLPRHQVCIVSNWSVQCTFIIIISILLFFNPTTQVNAGHSLPPFLPLCFKYRRHSSHIHLWLCCN